MNPDSMYEVRNRISIKGKTNSLGLLFWAWRSSGGSRGDCILLSGNSGSSISYSIQVYVVILNTKYLILASSLEYPQRIEWSQCLKRLILGCLQIFSFFPLSSSSFYTVQYRRVQYSTVIGPRRFPVTWPPGKRWPQCLNCLLASSLEYPQRIRVVSVFEFHVCSLLDCKFSNFFLFHPSLFIQYSTEECSTVQYKAKLGVYL